MAVNIDRNADESITVSVTFQPGDSMLESELNLQAALNEAGSAATGECLTRFDSDGGKMVIGGRKMTSKGRIEKTFQTPYGEARVARHVYQGSAGGAIYCPMEHAARIMRTSTPLFAKQMSFKYANANAGTVVADFAQHGRKVARSYVGEVSADVASVCAEKEGNWNYEVPRAPAGERVESVGIGVDGTCALFAGDSWRQVMVGTVSFYGEGGERIATTYIANTPESGKGEFYAKMEGELARVRAAHPKARYAGIADGAHDLWDWLEPHCTWRIVDFWHASEYLAGAAPGMARGAVAQVAWLEEACHRLKHEKGAAAELLAEFESARAGIGDGARAAAGLDKAISYFGNHLGRMDYWLYKTMGLPIGSGVTEAACKSVVKERLCGSGMKWSKGGAAEVLSLRTLVKSKGRWEEFWSKTARFGFSKITSPKR
jgi:hypothetical protein